MRANLVGFSGDVQPGAPQGATRRLPPAVASSSSITEVNFSGLFFRLLQPPAEIAAVSNRYSAEILLLLLRDTVKTQYTVDRITQYTVDRITDQPNI